MQYVSLDIRQEDAKAFVATVEAALGSEVASAGSDGGTKEQKQEQQRGETGTAQQHTPIKLKSKLHVTLQYCGREQPGHASPDIDGDATRPSADGGSQEKQKLLERLQAFEDTPARVRVVGVYSLLPHKPLIAAKAVIDERMLERWGLGARIESERAANKAIDQGQEADTATDTTAPGSSSSSGNGGRSVTIGLHITLGHGPEVKPAESNAIPADAPIVPLNAELLGTVALHRYHPR